MSPSDAQAQVIDSILSLPKGSPESHAAYRDYQATRMAIRPKLLQQKSLLELGLLTHNIDCDKRVGAIDAEIAALWMALDSRVWMQVAS